MITIAPDETLLGLLAVCPQHGYQLLEHFHDPARLGQVWKMSTSQLYAVLKRLENEGCTVGRPLTRPDAPTRVEYALTEKGRARLERWLHDPQPSSSVRHVRVEFLSRLYVASLLAVPSRPLIRRQRAACHEQRAGLQRRLARARPGIEQLALSLVIAQTDAILAWLERCEATCSSDET